MPYAFRLAFVAGLLGLLLAAPSQSQTPGDVWIDVSEAAIPRGAPRTTVPTAYRVVQLDRPAARERLATAPQERRLSPAADGLRLALPLPEGGSIDVHVTESSLMAPALQAKFPEVRTYLAQGPGSVHGRLSLTPAGFRGMLFMPEGTVYIDPYRPGDADHYVVYRASDLVVDPALRGRLADEVIGQTAAETQRRAPDMARAHGATLRTYRLAMAATGEYTQFHGGTVAAGLAAIVATMNRVTGIYERDLSVSFQLVANNNLIIYTDGATDPYTNSNGVTMLGQNITNLNAVIGSANFDVGHVFSTGGGGVAGLGVICTASKARGVTGLTSPVGDAFDVDYVAHELGHQFGGNHTFNGNAGACGGGNRRASTAYEPGSGSTIQAYAGICGAQDLQSNSDPYFHAISLDEMTAHVTTGSGGTCGTAAATNNAIPTVSATGGYTIPVSTPFALTGGATDDTPGALTYTWEELDLGPASAPGSATGPLFRSFMPTASPTRTFPQLPRLVAGLAPVIGETLPTTERTLTFRLTARDNLAGGGAINDATVTLTTTTAAGPFVVTFASTAGQTYDGGATVTWNVAGTNAGVVNTPTVDILYSTDNGASFGHVLAAGTPNDGSEDVSFPVAATQGRILIRAVDNVFFNVNSAPFEASAQPNEPPVADAGPDQTVVAGTAVTLNGSGSSDPDGDPLTFAWTLAPSGTLSDATAVGPTFCAATATTYTATLVVNDGADDSDPDAVTVTAISATAALDALAASVEALRITGALNKGQANGLTQKIDQARREVARGRAAQADVHLRDFEAQVASFQSGGVLTAAQAAALTAASSALRTAITSPCTTAPALATKAGVVGLDVAGLGAAYPNPASAGVTVPFALEAAAHVRLAVYDALGREVAVLVDGLVEAGPHTASFGGVDLPAGVYLVRLTTADGLAQTGRLTLLR